MLVDLCEFHSHISKLAAQALPVAGLKLIHKVCGARDVHGKQCLATAMNACARRCTAQPPGKRQQRLEQLRQVRRETPLHQSFDLFLKKS